MGLFAKYVPKVLLEVIVQYVLWDIQGRIAIPAIWGTMELTARTAYRPIIELVMELVWLVRQLVRNVLLALTTHSVRGAIQDISEILVVPVVPATIWSVGLLLAILVVPLSVQGVLPVRITLIVLAVLLDLI